MLLLCCSGPGKDNILTTRPGFVADIEWKLTYVGSPDSEKYDQVLDSVLIGPSPPGEYKFVFQVRTVLMPCICAQKQPQGQPCVAKQPIQCCETG